MDSEQRLSSPRPTKASLTWKQKLRAVFAFHKPEKHVPVHREKAFFGMIDRDTFETIRTFFLFQIEMFRVVMACLLVIFIPQSCNGDPCSPTDTISNLDHFELAVVIWNFVTLGFSVLHYLVVYHRERYLIRFLDVDDDVGEFQLPKILSRYSDIDTDLWNANAWLFGSSIISALFFLTNVVLSGILVFKYRFLGFQTATVFATNLGLVSMVLEKTVDHAWVGMQHRLALSCVEFAPVSYNVIDEEYVDPADETQGGRNEAAVERLTHKHKEHNEKLKFPV